MNKYDVLFVGFILHAVYTFNIFYQTAYAVYAVYGLADAIETFLAGSFHFFAAALVLLLLYPRTMKIKRFVNS